MNFTEDQLEAYISNLIFLVNKLNAFDVAEKYGLDIEERDRMYNVYWPIIVVNSFTVQELKEYLLLRKHRFTEVNGCFDLEIFIDNKNLGVNILKSELNELIGLTPLLWHSVDGTNFFEYRTASVDGRKTLLITDKNHNQLKFYFKEILEVLKDLKKIISSPNKKETSGTLKGFKCFHHTKDFESLKQLQRDLIKENLISSDTSKTDFQNIFSGEIFESKINWIGKRNQLSYLISSLKKDDFIKDKSIWVKSEQVFTVDNELVNKDQLRGSNQISNELSEPITKIINNLIELRKN